jgi:hypothetical protein
MPTDLTDEQIESHISAALVFGDMHTVNKKDIEDLVGIIRQLQREKKELQIDRERIAETIDGVLAALGHRNGQRDETLHKVRATEWAIHEIYSIKAYATEGYRNTLRRKAKLARP